MTHFNKVAQRPKLWGSMRRKGSFSKIFTNKTNSAKIGQIGGPLAAKRGKSVFFLFFYFNTLGMTVVHAKYDCLKSWGSWVYRASKLTLKNHFLGPGGPALGPTKMFSTATLRGSGGK